MKTYGIFALALALSFPAVADDLAYITGGIGDEEMARIKSKEADYSFKALFVGAAGQYLADVTVTISDSEGSKLMEATTDGPVLLVRLLPGKYKITASHSRFGTVLSKDISISSGKNLETTFRFPLEN